MRTFCFVACLVLTCLALGCAPAMTAAEQPPPISAKELDALIDQWEADSADPAQTIAATALVLQRTDLTVAQRARIQLSEESAYAGQKDFTAALKLANTVLSTPNLPDALKYLALRRRCAVYFFSNERDKGFADYVSALAVPGITTNDKVEILLRRGGRYIEQQDLDKAAVAAEACLALPNLSPMDQARAHSLRGNVRINQGDQRGAVEDYTVSLSGGALSPAERAETLLFRAKVYQAMAPTRVEESATDLDAVLAIPEASATVHVTAQLLRAQAYLWRGKTREAVDLLNAVLEEKKGTLTQQVSALLTLAYLHRISGRAEVAKHIANDVLAMDHVPDGSLASAHLELAEDWLALGDKKASLAEYAVVIDLKQNGDNVRCNALYERSQIFLEDNDVVHAVADLEAAKQLHGANIGLHFEVQFLLAGAYAKQGEPEKALTEYRPIFDILGTESLKWQVWLQNIVDVAPTFPVKKAAYTKLIDAIAKGRNLPIPKPTPPPAVPGEEP